MYLNFFKLKELPFRLTADPRFYFFGAAQEFAKSRLRNALADADGCMLLSGDAGVGKTTLLQDLLNEMPGLYTVVQIRNPEFSVNEFYQAVLAQLDERPSATVSSVVRANFDTCLARMAAVRRTLVLIVDNGELIGQDLLEELLRLPRRNGRGARNVRVLVAARSSIDKALSGDQSSPRNVHLALRVKLLPLKEVEARQYVELRLRIAAAGESGATFEDDAFPEIQRYSGGVPRLINTLADAALMMAFNRSRDKVGSVDIRSAVDQLKWVEFSSRSLETDLSTSSGRHRLAAADGDVMSEPRSGRIRIEHNDHVRAEFDLPIGKLTLGRAMSNDIRIDSQFISRHHCQILTTAHYSVVEDLQSQNGIVVGSRRVSVHRLQDGDRIVLGEHCLEYSVSQRAPSEKLALFPLVLPQKAGTTESGPTLILTSNPRLTGRPEDSAR